MQTSPSTMNVAVRRVQHSERFGHRALSQIVSRPSSLTSPCVKYVPPAAGIGRFLHQLWTQGALVGPSAAGAYDVVCDDTNNTPTTQAMGQLIAHLALAPSTPFEFVLLRLGLSDDSLDVQEKGVIAAGSG